MANRYWVGGNANWDATVGTKWAITSGGAGGSAVPTATDDVFLDNGAGTGNVTLASGYAAVCKSITCTGYVGTFASANATGSLSVSGAITFVAGMTLSCTNLLKPLTTATITAGGKTWGGDMSVSPATTLTLADNWRITGTLATLASGANTTTLNGNTLYIGAGLTINASNSLAGTTSLEMNGTGTWSHPSTTATVSNTLTFNTAGTITISGNVYRAGTNSLIYTAGTTVWTGSTLNLATTSGTQTINLNGLTINNLTFTSGNATYTISNNFTVSGTFLVSYVGASNLTINGSTISCAGAFTLNGAVGINIGGTTNFTLTGTGTWSHSTTCVLTSNLTINTAGTITISGNVYKGGAGTSITYTAGTVVTTGSTLNISADITLNTNGMSWNNISPTGTRTLTLNSLLTVTGTFTCVATTTFAGSYGFTITNWTCITAGVTVTFANGITYTLSGGTMTNTGTAASKILFSSDHATIKAILTLVGVTQANIYLSGTRMDSSSGGTVWTSGGILTTTINWNLVTAPSTISYGFSN